ncbi:unnamed protein product [Allacma fusca]|uniref:BTB domain-containing protein n=1 Tax=Allacma fusca TaxID=39272 RepID=A0A8J2PVI5_9HEXA|nr:unnamed protein product [Allacma fusca]
MAKTGTAVNMHCLRRDKHKDIQEEACEHLLRSRRDTGDVTLNSNDGKTFLAHKMILWARSRWFREKLEAGAASITLIDVTGDQLVQLIDLLYREHCNVPDYQYEELSRICETYGINI